MPRNPAVDEFLARVDHPHKPGIARVREIILAVDVRIGESIEQRCPTFTFGGTMASVVMRTNSHVHLQFPEGARLTDEARILDGDGRLVRNARFRSKRELRDRRDALESLVRQWIRLVDTNPVRH